MLDYEGATVTLIRCEEVPGLALWHHSGSSRRNSQVDPWRWNPENNVLACFRVFNRLPSIEADPSMDRTLVRGL
eukprot:3874776-Pyramimonas_sp.AAC.1